MGESSTAAPTRRGRFVARISALLDLAPQRPGILATIADPPHEIAHVRIEQARGGEPEASIGLLWLDKNSFMHSQTGFEPVIHHAGKDFKIADLLRYAL